METVKVKKEQPPVSTDCCEYTLTVDTFNQPPAINDTTSCVAEEFVYILDKQRAFMDILLDGYTPPKLTLQQKIKACARDAYLSLGVKLGFIDEDY